MRDSNQQRSQRLSKSRFVTGSHYHKRLWGKKLELLEAEGCVAIQDIPEDRGLQRRVRAGSHQ